MAKQLMTQQQYDLELINKKQSVSVASLITLDYTEEEINTDRRINNKVAKTLNPPVNKLKNLIENTVIINKDSLVSYCLTAISVRDRMALEGILKNSGLQDIVTLTVSELANTITPHKIIRIPKMQTVHLEIFKSMVNVAGIKNEAWD